MSLTNEDYHHVLKHFLTWVRRRDEVGYEHMMRFAEFDHEQPRQALLHCIRTYSHTVRPASRGTHGAVLRSLNANIEGEIDGITVMLSPAEQELYERETVDLVPVIDKTEFVEALHALYEMIESDERGDDDSRRNQR